MDNTLYGGNAVTTTDMADTADTITLVGDCRGIFTITVETRNMSLARAVSDAFFSHSRVDGKMRMIKERTLDK